MTDISKIIDDIVRREGGYINNPADKGGPTKYGITQKTLSGALGREATEKDVQDIDLELAREIYLQKYAISTRIYILPEHLIPTVLDFAVNSGPKRAISALQTVLNTALADLNDSETLIVDGTIGKRTLEAAQLAYVNLGKELINMYCDYRLSFVRRIVENNPSQKQFLKGWENRISSLRR